MRQIYGRRKRVQYCKRAIRARRLEKTKSDLTSCGYPAPKEILGKHPMKATQLLHNLGQSIWLDNITRDLLDSGTFNGYINELLVIGLTLNLTIFH